MPRQLEEKLIVAGFLISLTGILLNLVWDAVNPPGVASPMIYNVIIGSVMTGFTFVHSKRYFGLLKTSVLFIATALISLYMEHYGVVTGAIYGAYHYGTSHGPKVFNTVPIIIPMSWFMFIYPSVIISNEILSSETSLISFVKKGGNAFMIILYAAVDSITATALDILTDPVWTSKGAWTWTSLDTLRPEEIFYKIPVQNYFGWLITTFMIFLIFRTVFFLKKEAFMEKDRIYHLPVFNYFAIFIVGTIQAWVLLKNPGLIFVSIMTLGFISLVSLNKILQYYEARS